MGEEPLRRAGADFKRAGGIKGLGFKVEAQSSMCNLRQNRYG